MWPERGYDYEGEIASRLVLLCRHFAALSPWNVWELTYPEFRGFAAYVDAITS